MPLRRPFPLCTGALCLLALGAAPRTALPARPARLPAATAAPAPPAPAAVAAALLRSAQPWLVNPAALSDPPGAFRGQGVVELYNLRYEQVLPNGLSGIVAQRVFQIRDAGAASLFVLDDLWYDSSRNHFQLESAEVRRGNQILPGADQGDLHPGATGNQPRRVSLPDLRAGDRVSVTYLLLPDCSHDWSLLDGHFLGNLFAFRDSYPTLRARYVVASPTPIAFNQVGVNPPRAGRDAAGRFTWVWQAADQPAFFSQPDGPSLTDVSPFVQVSGFHSWAALATWYSGLLAARARMAPAFERRLLDLARGPARVVPVASAPSAAEERATVARVWSYLSAHLDYRGDESGVHAYVPAPVAQVFQSGSGDCKDGALLLVTWLRAAGLDADLALVRTPSMGRLAPAADGQAAATMAGFDHALVYIPSLNQWLDTTAPNLLDGELPASDQNALALIVRAGQHGLVRVPSAPPQANRTRRTVRLSPLGGGLLRAEGDIEVQGADAPDFRMRYASPGARRAELASWLRLYFPRARVQSVAVAGVAPSSDTVRVHFLATVARDRGFSVAWIRRHYAAILASQAERRDTLELPLRWEADETWSLDLASASCLAYPSTPPIHLAAGFGQLDVATSCAAGRFEVSSRVLQTAEQIAPADYGRFRAFWQTVDTTLNAPLLTPLAQPVARKSLLEIALSR